PDCGHYAQSARFDGIGTTSRLRPGVSFARRHRCKPYLAYSAYCQLFCHHPGKFQMPAATTRKIMSNFQHHSIPSGYESSPGAVVRHRVLRNTYWLLALSLVPTVLGALVGLNTGINNVMSASPGMTAILFLAGAFGLMFLIERNKNSSLGVALLLAFTFFMGIMLSRLLGFVLGMGNGAQLIMLAFGGTAAVFGAMASVASTTKRDFSGMQKFLFIGVVILIVASL